MENNILFLFADQWTHHALGFLSSEIQTPHLDSLSTNGVHFSHCYSNAPLCLPARAALATGLYPKHLCAMDNHSQGLNSESKTWMQQVQAAGYETSLFGKAHLHPFSKDLRDKADQLKGYGYSMVDELPGPRTYAKKGSSYMDHLAEHNLLDIYEADMKRRYVTGDVYDSSPTPLAVEHYADVYIAEQALQYLQHAPLQRPWCCTVSFGGPHDPWDTPREYAERYAKTPVPEPLQAPTSQNPNRPKGVYDDILSGRYDPSLTTAIQDMTTADIEALRRSYWGHITLIDEQIGRILDVLRHSGELDRTIIVFCADHGETNGDYGLLFKQVFLETSVRVPLLICAPHISAQTIKTPVELMDVGATLCDLIGLSMPFGYAQSLLPLMTQKDTVARRPIVSQLFEETMLLDGAMKAVFNQSDQIYMLFDLENDPNETTNLAATNAAQEQKLFASFAAWRREVGLLSQDA